MPDKKTNRASHKAGTAKVLSQSPLGVLLPESLLEFSSSSEPRPTIVFRSEIMGEGDFELGAQLLSEFFQALLAHPEPPLALLFYNSAVKLVLKGSAVLDAISKLSSRGCEVLACRTSLQKLALG